MRPPSSAWVPPQEGFTPQEVARFWSFVDKRDDGHMVWNHMTPSGQWFFTLRGRNVTPNRMAWAIAHPGEALPFRLWHSAACPYDKCVNINCWAVRPELEERHRPDAKPKRVVVIESARPGLPLEDPRPAALGEYGLAVPSVVEAYAALQFGLPVKDRPIAFRGRTVEEVPSFTESEQAESPMVQVNAPVGAAVMNPTVQDMEAAAATGWNDPAALLDFIFTPGTCVMTFGDHVWFWNKKVRVDAPDGPRALVAALTLMGGRKTVG